MKITTAMIDRQLELLQRHYPDDKLVLQQGSQVDGQAWRLYFDHGSLGEFPGLSDSYLGWTRREAYQTLRGILAGIEAQKLIQAATIRRAVAALHLSPGVSYETEAVAQALERLAPATEF